MTKAKVTRYNGIIAWLFNGRYLALVNGHYGSSNNETKAILKAQKSDRNRPHTYYVEVANEAK